MPVSSSYAHSLTSGVTSSAAVTVALRALPPPFKPASLSSTSTSSVSELLQGSTRQSTWRVEARLGRNAWRSAVQSRRDASKGLRRRQTSVVISDRVAACSLSGGQWAPLQSQPGNAGPLSDGIVEGSPTQSEDPTESPLAGVAGEEASFSENVVVLRFMSQVPGVEECVVFLVGTNHVSKESCEEVRSIIRKVKPDKVFVELCPDRMAMLAPQGDTGPMSLQDLIQAAREGRENILGALLSYVGYAMADKVEVPLGSDMRVAIEEAEKCGAQLVLGDKPAVVTIRRTWGMLPGWGKVKAILGLLLMVPLLWLLSKSQTEDVVEGVKSGDNMTLAAERMERHFSTVMQTLVHERDLIMTAFLRVCAWKSTSVVAVVGKGHLKGMQENWDNWDIDIEALLADPPSP